MMRMMKDSGVEWIGTIPDDWQLCKLKNIIEFKNGYAFDSSVLSNDGRYPVIRIGDIKDGGIDIYNANKIGDNQGLDNFLIKDKDILLAMSGATVGKLGYVDHLETECYINQRVGIIRAENSKYIYYYLSTEEFIKYVMLLSAGSAQPNISTENVNNYYLSFPNKEGQKKIVTFLDKKVGDINEIIKKTKASIEEYKKYKQAIISEAVTKGLDKTVSMKESGIEWLGQVPEHWKYGRIKYNTYIKGRIGWQGLKAEEFIDEGPYLVTGMHFGNNCVLWEECYHISEERFEEAPDIHLQQDDLIMTKDGTIGKVAYIDMLPAKATLNSHLLLIRPLSDLFINKYMMWLLKSNVFISYYSYYSYGSIMASISQEQFKNFNFFCPNKIEQEKIVNYLDVKCEEIDALIAKKEAFVEEMEAYKKSLIYEYVTGKKEVL